MSLSRRGFFDALSAGPRPDGLGLTLAARGHEASEADALADALDRGQTARGGRVSLPAGVTGIRINSNENPLGPGKVALDAMLATFPDAGRYPLNSTPNDARLVEALAAKHQAVRNQVVLGAGSQEVLRCAVRAFTSPSRHLVTAAPTFENCTNLARKMKHPVTEVKVDRSFRLDLDTMVAMARGAGLVFLNNPNNPTATVHGAGAITDFVERVRRISPDTVILIDEAYHDYVTDPDYRTAVPLALATPNVVVTRTFSKAYGMAGMRIGYGIGQADTITPLARLKLPSNVSVFGVAAAVASLHDPKHIEDERARNTEVRRFTVKTLEDLGAKPTASNTNFIFVDVGRPAKAFRDACARSGVMVGRDFPPFENTHARISIGTTDEMKRAVDVFRDVLRPTSPASGRQGR